MTAIPNLLAGLRAWLLTDPDTAALVGTRVFVYEVPQSEAGSMPRAAITLAPGGGWGAHGHRSTIRLGTQRVDLHCYGVSPSEAGSVQRAAHGALKHMIRAEGNGILLHRANLEMAALYLRDPDTDWPYVVESWELLASEVAVTP